MTPLNAATLAIFLLTTIAVYLLGLFPFIPPWAVFIAWACFFHMDGGINRNQAYFSVIMHIGLGALASWSTVLLLLNNPFDHGMTATLWGPVIIGIVIAMLSRMGALTRFCVTPAVIYGYASIFAFLNSPGLFSIEAQLSFSFQNALIAIGISLVLGASLGYANALMVEILTRPLFSRIKAQ